VGVLSDLYGLQAALAAVPAFGLLAAGFFMLAARSYEADARAVERIEIEIDRGDRASPALA
jgi:hypothetical protein